MYRTIYILILVLILSVSVSADTTTYAVTASSDDCAVSFTNGFSLTETLPYIGFVFGNYVTRMGIRFQNVQIPQGATIDTALISYVSGQTLSNVPTVDFYCEDTADATTFTDRTDYDARARTTASVQVTTWENPSTAGTRYVIGDPTDVNFKDIVQEVVNRGDWASGNDLVVFMEGVNTGSTLLLRARSYDYTGNTSGPEIYLVWTPPSEGAPSVRHSPDGNGVRHSPNGASVRHGG